MRCARAEHKSNSCRCRRSPRCRPPSNDLLPWPGCKSFIYIVHTRTHTYITWPQLRTKRSLTLAAGWCLLSGWLGAASESLAETRRALVYGGGWVVGSRKRRASVGVAAAAATTTAAAATVAVAAAAPARPAVCCCARSTPACYASSIYYMLQLPANYMHLHTIWRRLTAHYNFAAQERARRARACVCLRGALRPVRRQRRHHPQRRQRRRAHRRAHQAPCTAAAAAATLWCAKRANGAAHAVQSLVVRPCI